MRTATGLLWLPGCRGSLALPEFAPSSGAKLAESRLGWAANSGSLPAAVSASGAADRHRRTPNGSASPVEARQESVATAAPVTNVRRAARSR
jgi:hypothetical protein